MKNVAPAMPVTIDVGGLRFVRLVPYVPMLGAELHFDATVEHGDLTVVVQRVFFDDKGTGEPMECVIFCK